jgi:hypothetical protein
LRNQRHDALEMLPITSDAGPQRNDIAAVRLWCLCSRGPRPEGTDFRRAEQAFWTRLMDFQAESIIFSQGDIMAAPTQTLTASSTAALIREMAARYQVSYVPTQSDQLATHITRLSSDDVKFDEVECLLIALQRAGHITRDQLVHLQASYLREAKS